MPPDTAEQTTEPDVVLPPAPPTAWWLTVAGGVAALVGFRLGLLRGGTVGVDVVLAALAYWLAVGVRTWPALRRRIVLGWSATWRPYALSIALAIGWVLVVDDPSLDALVRGEALAGFGGYANWHEISRGPVELLATRASTPLQHVWVLGVVTQCVLAWAALVAATRRRAGRRPDRRDPLVVAGSAVAVVALLISLAMALAGAAGQTLLLATFPHATGFFAAAVAGVVATRPSGAVVRSVARGSRFLAVGGLVVLALFAAPDGDLARWSTVLLAPLLAVVAVVAAAPDAAAVAEPLPDPGLAQLAPWSGLVAAFVLTTPCLALVRGVHPGGSSWLVGAVGLVFATVLVVAVVVFGARASDDPAAIERRRVLWPPAIVALLVVLFSVTGAFRWTEPKTRGQWEKEHPSAPAQLGGRPGAPNLP